MLCQSGRRNNRPRQCSGKAQASKRGPDPETGAQPDEGLSGDPLKLAIEVYREVGGFRRFVEWAGAEKNIGVFYKDILLKMLAKAVEAAEDGKNEPVIVRVENTAKDREQ